MASCVSPQAQTSIQTAFGRLRSSVSPDDARNFQSTTLEDVRAAAREIERQLAARQCLRNMRRIQPFFEGLERYSKSIEVLCNGTPYLPWIWVRRYLGAPVKLMLQLASDYTTAFEKLITAYGQIADVLPRFDRFSAAFKENHDFQQVLGFVYADILEFHGRAYQFFRKRGWRCFFSSCWARFDLRFKGILESLAKNCELVDREAASIGIVEAKAWRTKAMEEMAEKEKQSSIVQFQAVVSWLQVGDSVQEDELDQYLRRCHVGTCDWITRNSKISAWMRQGMEQKILWLKGKPGSGILSTYLHAYDCLVCRPNSWAAGKSVLTANIVHFMQQDKRTVVLYYFCNNCRSSNSNHLAMIMRSLCGQLLRANLDSSAYVFDEYIGKGLSPSVQNLKVIIPSLLSGIQSVRIILDGLDECDQPDSRRILNEIIPLAACDGLGTTHKLLVSSRDLPQINRVLAKKSTISLSEEKDAVNAAIRTYVHATMVELQDRLVSGINCSILEEIENKIVERSDGMFLWVRLVLTTLEQADSVRELKDAVDTLPKGLQPIYGRILANIKGQLNAKDFEKALRILGWMAFAKRPLKDFELQDGIALHIQNRKLDHDTKLWGNVFDVCKPLIEEDRLHQTVVFVHFSVKEYGLFPMDVRRPVLTLARYILDALSGPFISGDRAHHDIAFACIAYLCSSFDLIDPRVPSGDLLIRVGEGFHGLHLYANAYWLDHLLSYVDMSKSLDTDASSPLVTQLLRLCETHQQLLDTVQNTSISRSLPLTAAQSDKRMGGLSGYPEIHAIAQQVLGSRQRTIDYQPQNCLEDTRAVDDYTLFNRILQSYNDIVQELLSARTVLGLRQEALTLFKERYGPFAYVCRHYDCERATAGFSSRQALAKHEDIHAPKLICNVLTCDYAVIGFRTSRALKQHLETFHPNKATLQVPTTLRRPPRTPSRTEPVSNDSYMVSCYCNNDKDDGYTISCGSCGTLQHVKCYYYQRDIPESHTCSVCHRRQLLGSDSGIRQSLTDSQLAALLKRWQQKKRLEDAGAWAASA
ncbi:MAG: hypothetical protein M1816_004363 [Peltula sp. TS41687]|nr:MAG: hypothetical protein M1816_004363 [Peltula sp. TS41687]